MKIDIEIKITDYPMPYQMSSNVSSEIGTGDKLNDKYVYHLLESEINSLVAKWKKFHKEKSC